MFPSLVVSHCKKKEVFKGLYFFSGQVPDDSRRQQIDSNPDRRERNKIHARPGIHAWKIDCGKAVLILMMKALLLIRFIVYYTKA